MKAVAYCRVSGIVQLEGNGIDRQEELIRTYAQQKGIEIEKVYTEAYRGSEGDRPVFIEMMSDLLSNGVRMVIIESLDRLARDLLVQSSLLAKLAAEGITLIAALSGENVTESMQSDPIRRALVQIQGIFSELDKNMLVRRLNKGKAAAREAGKRVDGRFPYGVRAGEKECIRRAKSLHRYGLKIEGKIITLRLSWEEVAEQLNKEGYRNRAGGLWTRAHIWKCCQTAR